MRCYYITGKRCYMYITGKSCKPVIIQQNVVISQESVVISQESVLISQKSLVILQEYVVISQENVTVSQESVAISQEIQLLTDSSLVLLLRTECVALYSGYKADSTILFLFPTFNKDDQQKSTNYDSNNTRHNAGYCTT